MLNTPSRDTGYQQTLTVRPWSGNCNSDAGRVELATNNTAAHLNLYVRNTGEFSSVCMNADDAKKLRDMLIEAYPLPAAKPARSYRAELNYDDYSVIAVEMVSYEDTTCIAAGLSEQHAIIIAKALNELEGR